MFELIYDSGGFLALAAAVLAVAAGVVWIAYSSVRPHLRRASSAESTPESLFVTVAWGYFWGATTIMLPVFLVASVGSVASGGSLYQLFAPLMVPVVVAVQAVVLGLAVTLGNSIREYAIARFRRDSS